MYISVQNLGLFILFCIVVVVGIYLIITLRNLNKVLTETRKIIDNNNDNINKTVDNLTYASADIKDIAEAIGENKHVFYKEVPETIDNIHTISASLKNISENADQSLEVVSISLIETANTVKESTQDLTTYIKIISEVLNLITQAIFPKKK